MFPTEIEINYHQQELQRAAENYRLVQSMRTAPTFWQRLRTHLSSRPDSLTAQRSENQLAHRDIIATSR